MILTILLFLMFMKQQRPRIVKTCLRNTSDIGELDLPLIKTYFKATINLSN